MSPSENVDHDGLVYICKERKGSNLTTLCRLRNNFLAFSLWHRKVVCYGEKKIPSNLKCNPCTIIFYIIMGTYFS